MHMVFDPTHRHGLAPKVLGNASQISPKFFLVLYRDRSLALVGREDDVLIVADKGLRHVSAPSGPQNLTHAETQPWRAGLICCGLRPFAVGGLDEVTLRAGLICCGLRPFAVGGLDGVTLQAGLICGELRSFAVGGLDGVTLQAGLGAPRLSMRWTKRIQPYSPR